MRYESFLLSNAIKILNICIMKLRMDSLHYALSAVLVLLLVYCGTRFFKEGLPQSQIKSSKQKADKSTFNELGPVLAGNTQIVDSF